MSFYNKVQPMPGDAEATAPDKIADINAGYGGYTSSLDFYNNLPIAINIGMRDGSKITLRPQQNPNLKPVLYITRRVVFDTYNTGLHIPDEIIGGENLRTANCYHYNFTKEKPGKFDRPGQPGAAERIREVILEYTVDMSEMQTSTCWYLKNLDVVVTTELRERFEHPYSLAGLRIASITDNEKMNSDHHCAIDIEIIMPNETGQAAKYINLNGAVYKVPIHSSSLRDPGVYINFNGYVDKDNITSSAPIAKYYPISELYKQHNGKDASELPWRFYDTPSEARANGNITEMHKREVESIKHELEMRKIELEEAKLKRHELEEELKTSEAANKRVQDEIDRYHKERNDIREQARKELEAERDKQVASIKLNKETVTMVTTIIAGVAVVLGVIKTIMTTPASKFSIAGFIGGLCSIFS